jgi:hypothetical protein
MICSSLCRVPFIAVLLSWVGRTHILDGPVFWGSVITVMAWKTCRRFRLLPMGANWQPAFAAYELTSDGSHFAARAIHVLTLENGLIQRRYLFHRQARACFPLLGFRSDFQIPRFGERARSRTKNLPIFDQQPRNEAVPQTLG